jgi:hypothetical protein
MSVINCFRCDSPLTPLTFSAEHLIPQALGGRLKSKKLLCRSCNSLWGEHPDSDILRFFATLCTALDIKRDRGDSPRIHGELSDGTKITMGSDGKPELAVPKFVSSKTNDGFEFSITARCENELRRMLKGLKEKHPALNVDDVVAQAKHVAKAAEGPAKFRSTADIDAAFREALKIALGFLVLMTNDRSLAKKLSSFVDESGDTGQIVCWSRDLQPFPALNNIVHHYVVLVGSKEEQILYAQTSLFGVLTCTVILDDAYLGENLTECHVEYPLSKKSLTKLGSPRRFTKAEIAAVRAKGRTVPNDIMPRMQAIVNLGQTRMENEAMTKHYMEGFMSILQKPENNGVLITQELIGSAIREASLRVQQWAETRSGKK